LMRRASKEAPHLGQKEYSIRLLSERISLH
jgi:hypothetical protein